jgi:hypothetical protein
MHRKVQDRYISLTVSDEDWQTVDGQRKLLYGIHFELSRREDERNMHVRKGMRFSTLPRTAHVA